MCPREVGRPVSRLQTLSWASPLKLWQRDLPVVCRGALELALGMVGAGRLALLLRDGWGLQRALGGSRSREAPPERSGHTNRGVPVTGRAFL